MDQVQALIVPGKQFAKDSIRLVKRCTKPDRKEYQKIAFATAIGFAIMGFIGFFVKLIHIPINNIICHSKSVGNVGIYLFHLLSSTPLIEVPSLRFSSRLKNDWDKYIHRMAVDTRILLLISGKRKSGKDFFSNLLMERLSTKWKTVVVGLSHSLKEEYASINVLNLLRIRKYRHSVIIERLTGLNYSELITSGDYKERYRREMIKWGEEIRKADPAYFVRKALSSASDADVVIVSDCRRKSDMENMEENRRVTVRVSSLLSSRLSRGFIFKEGIDDGESECGLDEYDHFDVKVQNDGDSASLYEDVAKIEVMIDRLMI
uniref:Phosphomevalonate kinase n=1 Tax=Pristionchus pacificus TaxID=54126 RepID=A0A8R1YWL5_PRIPA